MVLCLASVFPPPSRLLGWLGLKGAAGGAQPTRARCQGCDVQINNAGWGCQGNRELPEAATAAAATFP